MSVRVRVLPTVRYHYSTFFLQSPQARITWKQCANLPLTITSHGTAVAVDGKVHYGTGDSVFCYNLVQDNWIQLMQTPVIQFGLGYIEGKLVIVGGYLNGALLPCSTNKVCTHDGLPKSKWKQTLPVMPTARASPGVLSSESALIVAGGFRDGTSQDCVEIFKAKDMQWHSVSALPSPRFDMSMVCHQGICYTVGGRTIQPSSGKMNRAVSTTQTYCASLEELLSCAVSANQSNDVSDGIPVWKTLADTSSYSPAVSVLAGSIVAIGGHNKPDEGMAQSEVSIYSPSANSWINMFDLPTPLAETTAVAISSTEILVIGGTSKAYIGTVMFNL